MRPLIAAASALYITAYAFAWTVGWSRTPAPGATVQAPPFISVVNATVEIFTHNVSTLLVLVVGSICSAGAYALVLHVANGYMLGVFMRALAIHAPDVSPWLWAFVPSEMLAFSVAGGAAVAVSAAAVGALRTGRSLFTESRAAAHALAGSICCLAASALLEAILIQWAWRL